MRTEWERDVNYNRLQRDGLTPYKEMLRWRRWAISGWSLVLLLALALGIAIQVLLAIR